MKIMETNDYFQVWEWCLQLKKHQAAGAEIFNSFRKKRAENTLFRRIYLILFIKEFTQDFKIFGISKKAVKVFDRNAAIH